MGEQCGHQPNRLYRARAISVIKGMQMREVSLVRRPHDPEARLLEVPVSTEDLAKALGDEFRLGVPVSCDKCLDECWGFDELPAQDAE